MTNIGKDKIMHLVGCAVVAFIISSIIANASALAFPSCLSGFLGAIACGAGKEYGDACSKDNHWSWGDIAYDAIGAVIGSTGGLLAFLI